MSRVAVMQNGIARMVDGQALVADDAGRASCCCVTAPCFHRYDACPDNECDDAEGTIYVVCSADCQVVAWGGGCYQKVDDTQYTDCQGGDPPPGFVCLPDGAVTVLDDFECVPDCADDACFNLWFLPELCPGQGEPPASIPIVRCTDVPADCEVFEHGGRCWHISPSSPSRPDKPPNSVVIDPPFNQFGSCCLCDLGDCDEQELDECWSPDIPNPSCSNGVPPTPCCCQFERVQHQSELTWHRDVFGGEILVNQIDITATASGSLESPGIAQGLYSDFAGEIPLGPEPWPPQANVCHPIPYVPSLADCDIPANLEPPGQDCAICIQTCDILFIEGTCEHQAGALRWVTTMTLTASARKLEGDCGTQCDDTPLLDPLGGFNGNIGRTFEQIIRELAA